MRAIYMDPGRIGPGSSDCFPLPVVQVAFRSPWDRFTSSFLLLVVMHLVTSSFLLLVAMHLVTIIVIPLLLVVMPSQCEVKSHDSCRARSCDD